MQLSDATMPQHKLYVLTAPKVRQKDVFNALTDDGKICLVSVPEDCPREKLVLLTFVLATYLTINTVDGQHFVTINLMVDICVIKSVTKAKVVNESDVKVLLKLHCYI